MPTGAVSPRRIKTGTCAGQSMRTGKDPRKQLLINGHPVCMRELRDQVNAGWIRFWEKRGGPPPANFDRMEVPIVKQRRNRK